MAFVFFLYMEETQLHIKNMVCPRCIMVVRSTLEKHGAEAVKVELGDARFLAQPDFSLQAIERDLNALGFQILKDPEEQLTEQIRLKVLEYLRLSEDKVPQITLSAFLTESLHKNYTALSKHFARQFGQTIETYSIHCRIERVKELLHDSELNVSQIADKLNYSSVHYLSGQFKKVTGISISEFKNSQKGSRTSLDKV